MAAKRLSRRGPRAPPSRPAPRTWAGGQGWKAAGRASPRLAPRPQWRAERSFSPRAEPFIAPPLSTFSSHFTGPRSPLPADPGPPRLASQHSPPLPPCPNCAMGANKGAAALYSADVTAGRGPGCTRRRAQQGEAAASRVFSAAASGPGGGGRRCAAVRCAAAGSCGAAGSCPGFGARRCG